MSYILTMRDSFTTDFTRLPRQLQTRMEQINKELRENPTQVGGNIKKLKGFETLWRYRVGDYRIIYAVIDQFVEYLMAGPRGSIYDRLDNYNPDAPDAARAQKLEAMFFPDSDVAKRQTQDEHWYEYANQLAQRQITKVDTPLPELLTPEKLALWNVPAIYHNRLMECQTEAQLNQLFDLNSVPDEIMAVLIDRIWPKHAGVIASQPVRVITADEDLNQFVEGKISAFLLKLDPQQETLVDWALEGPTLIKGGPGSGKSTVAMYRVRAVIERAKSRNEVLPKILFTTYTNSLVNVTTELLHRLLGADASTCEVTTVDKLATSLAWQSAKTSGDVLPNSRASDQDWRDALQAVRPQFTPTVGNPLENALAVKALAALEDNYLLEEFDWVIEGRGLKTLANYLNADRSGRGQALPERIRKAVWQLYEKVKQQLLQQKMMSWGDVRRRAIEYVTACGGFYDYVIIDEAQDLTPLGLQLCAVLAKDARNIFLTADVSQSIYNRSFSFSKVNEMLNVSRRTRHLKRNYRTTYEIMRAALQIMNGEAGDPETLTQTCLHYGPKPTLIITSDEGQNVHEIQDYIVRQARTLGLPPGAAVILCRSNNMAKEIATRLTETGLKAKYTAGDSMRIETSEVKVMTIHASKGLEFPIVVLPFVDRDVLPRRITSENTEEIQSHENRERRLFFVAASRAMRSLLITTSGGEKSSPFIEPLTEVAWDIQQL